MAYLRACEVKSRVKSEVDEVEEKEEGSWSTGNVEGMAGMTLVHGRDPPPPFYDPASDGLQVLDVGSFVEGAPTIFLKALLPS